MMEKDEEGDNFTAGDLFNLSTFSNLPSSRARFWTAVQTLVLLFCAISAYCQSRFTDSRYISAAASILVPWRTQVIEPL